MLRTVIVDDEALARVDLRSLLGAHSDVTIVGEAGSIQEARALLTGTTAYDLVFLDVQLFGGNGFDLVPDVHPEARIVFVTAYNRFALRAFEVNALDYLRKPVRVQRLAETLNRLGRRAEAPRLAPATTRPALTVNDLVSVKTGPGARRFIPLNDLVLLSSDDNYSQLTLATGGNVLVRETLASWEERLPATHFFRVHRQAIVNLSRIQAFEHQDDETTVLRVAHLREPVRARRARWPDVCARLAALGVHL
jgi:two-component system LytT family response regulator